jgi:hypothetical protein
MLRPEMALLDINNKITWKKIIYELYYDRVLFTLLIVKFPM